MPLPSFRLDGQVALVSGASRGIGRAILHALAQSGATVVGTATTPAGAAAISAGLAQAGFAGRGIVLDVACDASVAAALNDIESQEGPVALLVNNAGITRDTLLVRMKSEDWDAILNTNLSSVFRLSKAVLRGMMKARTGRIISIASIVGQIGNAGQANYAAAKAGIIGFTRSLAREVASRGITANVVAPGFVETDMTAFLGPDDKKKVAEHITVGRLGIPEDIAAAVAYLTADDAGYITGQVLVVDGGLPM